MSAFHEETVLTVHHWTDRLFSFTTTRDQALRFSNGHFTMIGLKGDNGKPLLRAYSIVSANYEENLEFLSIKVPDGPLTSKLQHIKPGDKIIVGRKPTGTLLVDYLLPGKNLYLLGSVGKGRKQVQILNRRDDCCFGAAQHKGADYEPAMRAYEKRVQQAVGAAGSFRLVIDDDAPKHMISPQAVETMLKELGR